MDPLLIGLAVPTLLGLCSTSTALKIQVHKDGRLLNTLTDNNAAFYDRSYQVPTSPVQGILVYASPRNACQAVQTAPQANGTNVFAFIEEYTTCAGTSESNLQAAAYFAMIAFSSENYAALQKQTSIAQALFFDSSFKTFLQDNAITNDTSDLNPNTTVYVSIQDDSSLKLQELFYIFGAIILFALLISIFIFCCSVCWRVLVVKWRTRGLSRWQIRRLPKKKYRRSRDGACETCSICLEEFKEGEPVRILPCDHVFHPKCVDVWLQKWNRTCPLCKSTIKRRGKPLFSGDPESSRLLSESGGATPSGHPTDTGEDEVDGVSRGGQAHAHAATVVGASGNYGAIEHSSPLRLVTAAGHRRSTSGVSSSSSQSGKYRRSSRLSKSGSKQEPTTSVTTIELNITSSGETSRSASSSPSRSTSPQEFHTPRQSDDDDDENEGGNDDNKELTPSFRTAIGENGSMSSSVRV